MKLLESQNYAKENRVEQKDQYFTLCVLRLDKGLDEFVCGLGVEGKGVVERLKIRTLFQESFLQTHTTGMEILLTETETGKENISRV